RRPLRMYSFSSLSPMLVNSDNPQGVQCSTCQAVNRMGSLLYKNLPTPRFQNSVFSWYEFLGPSNYSCSTSILHEHHQQQKSACASR
ncbi:hypothetical protein STEG23_013621, partial [Scotinomys teguina]